VAGVELDIAGGQVRVRLEHAAGIRWKCPECERELACYDHAEERTWRHLDTCQLQTLLVARLPRVKCPEHGVRQVSATWAEPHGRFTLLFERFAIDVLLATQTVKNACDILRISWDEAWHIAQRAVARGQSRKAAKRMAYIGVDEKAFRKGHSYVTVVTDLDVGTVEHVADGRKKESLTAWYETLSLSQLISLQGIAMDMWEPYIQATKESVPLAAEKIVFDRFHVMQHVTKAVDAVRKEEHRELLAQDDQTLKQTKYLWLTSEENLSEKRREQFAQLKSQNLRTGRAWAIKECLRELWSYRRRAWGRKFFRHWYAWATRSRLEPMRRAAQTLRRHLENILTYCVHPITNAVSEGINSKIMTLKRKSGGYRNPKNFHTAIYFHCGGLDLYPR
jgi:transposase